MASPKAPSKTQRAVVENRKARHDYFIEESLEAGLALTGTEVKSVRLGLVNLSDAYAVEEGGDIWLLNVHIGVYPGGSHFNHEPKRPRRLLLHRRQINKMMGRVQREGYSLVPLKLYFNDRGRLKLELGLARGKKQHDKRQSIKERDWQREKSRLMRVKG